MHEIRVLVADDEHLMRSALAMFIDRSEGLHVVGIAEDGAAAVQLAQSTSPDVILLDLHMPVMDGFEAAQRLVDSGSDARLLAVTTLGSTESIIRALQSGFSGYLLKDSGPDEVAAAIRALHAGSGALSPGVAEKLISSVRATSAPALSVAPLNENESKVLDRLAAGCSNAEIAAALHLSESTVKTHLGSIMTKWKVRDRVQVLITGVRAGIVTL